jgi:hypothetical protein
MALVICPECEKRVSDKAISCPECGFPVAKEVGSKLGHETSLDKGKEASTGTEIKLCKTCGKPLSKALGVCILCEINKGTENITINNPSGDPFLMANKIRDNKKVSSSTEESKFSKFIGFLVIMAVSFFIVNYIRSCQRGLIDTFLGF